MLLRFSTCAGSTLMLRKAILNNGLLFDEDLKRHQDVHFLIIFLREYKLAFTNDILAVINGHTKDRAVILDTRIVFGNRAP